MSGDSGPFDRFAKQQTVSLTSYRRDGTPVRTPVNVAVDGKRAFVRTQVRAGKFKRMKRNPDVEIAPSTFLGRVTGPALRARARLLEGDEAAYASRMVARKHRIQQGIIVPILHRLRRDRAAHFELTPAED